MGPIAILDSDNLIIGRYEGAQEARQALKGLEPGTYHVVRFLNEKVVVAPAEPVVKTTVNLGQTYIRRSPKAAPKAEG